MKRKYLSKAQPNGDEKVEDLILSFTCEYFDYKYKKTEIANINSEAKTIEESLHKTISGAVYDALLSKMLERKSSHFRVSYKDLEESE